MYWICIWKKRGEKLMREVKEFDRISSHIKEYFQKVAFSEQRPRVFYMDYNEMMNSITRVTKSTYI
ncbi:MAG: hypothetical protein DRO92_01925 [Candidatus Altiarchaeales archaeon]|nr:MAG: hypothetical protein DRO92_01925 [Candidatus Altiarchaeales archaeon]